MIKNYLKIALRNVIRDKGYSFINITGLAIGICLFVLIMLFVQNEFSYDRYNDNYDRIYKVVGKDGRQPSMAPAIGQKIKETIPEIQKMVRFKFRNDYLVQLQSSDSNKERNSIIVRNFAWADSAVFEIFNHTFIKGDPKTALKDPFSIVLTEGVAKRIFKDVDPLGKTLRVNNSINYKVTGVIKEPGTSHLNYDLLASFNTMGETIGKDALNSYKSWNLATYVLLPKSHNSDIIASKITKIFKKKLKELFVQDFYFKLSPLADLYFSGLGSGNHGNLQLVYSFIAIAIFILLIAAINFIVLSTARATNRAKEVGVKKVLGSDRSTLVFQFISESVLFSLIASIIALLLVLICLPAFNSLIGKAISLSLLFSPLTILLFFLGVLLVGVLSGLYPAFYISSFLPITNLKKRKDKKLRFKYF